MIIDHSLVSPEDIKAAVEVAINSQYTDLASLTILVFDWMLTFPSEVELVWGSKWSAMTILYFLTRYIPFVYLPANTRYIFNEGFTLSECKMLYSTVSSLFWIGILFAQLILTIRTWVIWGKSKKLAYWLFGLYGSGTLHGPGETYSNSCDATTQKSSRCLGAALTILAAYETGALAKSTFTPDSINDGLGIRFYIYLFETTQAFDFTSTRHHQSGPYISPPRVYDDFIDVGPPEVDQIVQSSKKLSKSTLKELYWGIEPSCILNRLSHTMTWYLQ
ncbi:hypothetical protein AGABI1DRAFT_90409 [Agaricus bisporus var. burnettii JB137-S8]|uniref:DUF6533 domain-containing protein n=1 Tax=Agaricus bisporus var. burnettii (strain JB137-S8 / ATCC MYA-4627 / FGSC 10392) TaxID=597362 RepID=K5Y2N9_AGABU|nr:uncharacterized protein AGABI1DRAFT_90409 [Agaricus bisporus var. burnettii JB137-S8]EKM82140.1 hypothetical protein AGABI1DRAFT_90409 [Agaricus bisporus var. burnettii JB137-S8]